MRKHQRIRLSALWLLAVILKISGPSHAEPWVEVGDEQTRHHLLNLRDTGAIETPLTTWPLPWADIAREINNIKLSELNSSQIWSLRYLKHALSRADRVRTSRKRLYAGNSLIPFSYFGSDAKDDAFLASETNYMNDNLTINISAKAINDPVDGDDYQLDGSYIAVTFKDWILGLGAVERWWGPGWQSSLVLSNNARPGAGVFLRKKEALRSDLPILKHAGAWTFDLFAERLLTDRNLNGSNFVGARLSTSLRSNLELGLSSTLLIGRNNKDRPTDSNFTSLGEGLSILKNGERYQQISYDARFTLLPTLTVYGQHMVASRENSESSAFSKDVHATQVGLESAFLFFDIHNRILFELSDSNLDGNAAEDLAARDTSYLTFEEAYRYKSRSLGESGGYIQRKISLAGEHFFPNGHQLSWRLLRADDGKALDSSSEIRDQGISELNYKAPVNEYLKASVGIFILKNNMVVGTEEVQSGANIQLDFRF